MGRWRWFSSHGGIFLIIQGNHQIKNHFTYYFTSNYCALMEEVTKNYISKISHVLKWTTSHLSLVNKIHCAIEIIFPWQKFSSCDKGTVCNTFLCLWWRYNLKHFGSSTRERYSMTLYFIYKRNIFYDTFLHLWEEDSLRPNTHKLETKHLEVF